MKEEINKKIRIFEELKKIDKKIICVAPKYSKKYLLRIYKNGGLFGEISDKETSKSKLISEAYAKHCSDIKKQDKLKEYIINAKNEDDVISTFLNQEYLQLANEAFNNKWKKQNDNKKNNNSKAKSKERNIENEILSKFMKTNKDFITIDMEVQCPSEWFKNMRDDKEIEKIDSSMKRKLTDGPRFDIISFSKDGIGIIELKCDNDNYDNILSHYAHLKHVLCNEYAKEEFFKDMRRRIDILMKYNLINKELVKKYEKNVFNEEKLWCGILFVFGELKGSVKIAKELENCEKINEIKFLYSPSIDKIDFNNWKKYKDFISLGDN